MNKDTQNNEISSNSTYQDFGHKSTNLEINRTINKKTTAKKFKQIILSSLSTIFIVLAIVIPIRIFLGSPFIVNGASMDPSFETWDYLIIDKFTYKFLHEPKRGDVAIFVAPVSNHKYFIKRIIGLPGEKIEIKDGHVFVYNKKYPEGFELKEPYISTTNLSYDNIKHTLNEDEYFVMGDNRAGSYDSRYWGPLKRSAIIGRPILRLYPFSLFGLFPAEYNNY